MLAPSLSGTCAFPTGTFSVVLAFTRGLEDTSDFGVDFNLPLEIIGEDFSGVFFAALIAFLSIIFTNSFQAQPRVLSSDISAISFHAVALYVQTSGFLIISPIVSSVPSCSTSVCGALRPSTIADCVISPASFLSVEYWFFSSAYFDHFKFCITAVSILSESSCTHFTKAE